MKLLKVFKLKFLFTTLVILILLFIGAEHANAQLADSPWPMFHKDAQHTGVSLYNAGHVDGTIKWTFTTGAGVESSPAIGADGTVYIGSHDANLYALNPDGTQKWAFDTGDPIQDTHYDVQKAIMASPAVATDGTIYINSSSDYLFAINPDGTEKWRFFIKWSTDFWTAPAIGSDGTIYIGSARDDVTSFESGLYAINPDGTERWHAAEVSGIPVPPSISADGTIYYGAGIVSGNSTADKGKIVAVNPDGQKLWEFETELWVEGASAVGSDGTIYSGTKEGYLYALNSDGTQKWRYLTGDGISSCPAIGTDGTIYVGSWDTYLYAFNSDGTLKWRFKTPEAYEGVTSSPAISADGIIYFGTNSGNFYAVDVNGNQKWFIEDIGSIPGSPAIGSDGTIYFGTWNNNVYAITGVSPGKNFFAFPEFVRGGYFVTAADINGDGQEEILASTDTGMAPQITIYNNAGVLQNQFYAYDSSYRTGVRIAVGDVDGDGTIEIMTVPGAGGNPHIRIFNSDGSVYHNGFFALDGKFRGGAFVAAGDVNDDGRDEVVVTAGAGGGPHVTVHDHAGTIIANFMAYASNFRYGIRPTCLDFDDDNRYEIITGPDIGAPHIQMFSIQPNLIKQLNPGFYAFDSNYRGGVSVVGGDINGDSIDEIIVGVGNEAEPKVKIFNKTGETLLYDLLPFTQSFLGGVNVGAGDVDEDGKDELLVMPRSSGGPQVRVIDVE